MEDKPLRVHGTPQPKGLSWLKEVKVDAARNAVENLRRQQERKEFEEAKARGITPEEIIQKGKEDLAKADPGSFGHFAVEEPKEKAEDKKEVKANKETK